MKIRTEIIWQTLTMSLFEKNKNKVHPQNFSGYCQKYLKYYKWLFLSKQSLKSSLSPYRLLGWTPGELNAKQRKRSSGMHESSLASPTLPTELYFNVVFFSKGFFISLMASTFLLLVSGLANMKNRSHLESQSHWSSHIKSVILLKIS